MSMRYDAMQMGHEGGVAHLPSPPYYAVIFTSIRTNVDRGYDSTADRMVALAKASPGYLGIESARQELGITVSYWKDLESIRAWKTNLEHQVVQETGKAIWYADYMVRVALVERAYGASAL